MMAGVRGWLLAVITVSLLCALADALMPPGAVRRVGRLVCGLALLAAVLSPLVRLDVSGGQGWLEDYFAGLELRTRALEEGVDSQMKAIIEQEYAAYIVDKAAELGLTCSVRVECREEEGLLLPARTAVTGAISEEIRAELTRIIETDLGVPAEGQTYISEEGLP